jgi:hypothetical protein
MNPVLATMNLTAINVEGLVLHVVNLLQTDGPLYLETIKTLVSIIQYISQRDLTNTLMSLSAVGTNFIKIAADFKAEFGL